MVECKSLSLAVFFLFLAVVFGFHYASPQPLVNAGGAVLVTGASSGIGLSAAKRLKQEGLTVFAAHRKAQDAIVLESFGLIPILLDVTIPAHIEAAFQTIQQSQVPLVGIVNNAGSTTKKPLETVHMSTVRQVFDVNVFGALAVTQRFLPLLRDTVSNGGGARVVFIGSVSGIISLPLNGVYSMSKYALEAMADTLRRELYKSNIAVSMVNPAYVNTNFRSRGVNSIQDISALERTLYGAEFDKLNRKMKKRVTFAAPCCNVTDDAISHAVLSANPRTRYYPAVVAPHVPAWLMTPVIRSLGVFTFTERLADWIVVKFF
jgi:NAD(P)-dependent dehydrogenase (short-subunit alcohol dehydrogenase family)|tara:strand:+ start:124 stop:1080 length:957 start_codon:yes stop_codon:yes gene_type:complete